MEQIRKEIHDIHIAQSAHNSKMYGWMMFMTVIILILSCLVTIALVFNYINFQHNRRDEIYAGINRNRIDSISQTSRYQDSMIKEADSSINSLRQSLESLKKQ